MSHYHKHGAGENEQRHGFRHKRDSFRLMHHQCDDEQDKQYETVNKYEVDIQRRQIIEKKIVYGVTGLFGGICSCSVIYHKA